MDDALDSWLRIPILPGDVAEESMYKAPVEEILFTLKQVAGLGDALAAGKFGDLTEDVVDERRSRPDLPEGSTSWQDAERGSFRRGQAQR